MTIGTVKSPDPRNRNNITVIKSKLLSVNSKNTLLAILKVTDARRDVRLAGGLYHRFPWRHLPPWFISHDFRNEHGTWLSILETEEVKDVNMPFSTTFASPVTNIKELLILKGTKPFALITSDHID